MLSLLHVKDKWLPELQKALTLESSDKGNDDAAQKKQKNVVGILVGTKDD